MKLEALAMACGHLHRLESSHQMMMTVQRELETTGQPLGFAGGALIGNDADSVRAAVVGILMRINLDAKEKLIACGVDFSDLTNDFVGNVDPPPPMTATASGTEEAHGFRPETATVLNEGTIQ